MAWLPVLLGGRPCPAAIHGQAADVPPADRQWAHPARPAPERAGHARRTGVHRMTDWRDDFFVGWSGRLPRRHASFLRGCIAGAVCVFLLLGLALARATDDPGDGAVDWDAGEKTFRGVSM